MNPPATKDVTKIKQLTNGRTSDDIDVDELKLVGLSKPGIVVVDESGALEFKTEGGVVPEVDTPPDVDGVVNGVGVGVDVDGKAVDGVVGGVEVGAVVDGVVGGVDDDDAPPPAAEDG